MKTILYILTLALFFSCQDGTTENKKVTKKVNDPALVKVNCQADYQVQGMVCQMGCGGSIRKELKATGGVGRVDVNFIKGQENQLIQVNFDSTIVSINRINSILNTMNDHQFIAKLVTKKSI